MVDFSFLRQQGIGLLQQLCGDTWTDYNLHDPGVTILEAVCYALTDLSYRTEFPIADILSDKNGNIHLEKNAFFIREDILSSNPVTVNDFRKFILDKVDCLHNVWLEPVISGFSYGAIHGLYTMKVQVKREFAEYLAGPPEGDKEWADALKKEVHACFVSGRNLCEDLVRNINMLKPVSIRVRAEVIVTDDHPELLLASVYRELEATINPPVKYYTEQELLDKGYRVEDIHAGPLLKKGFIPDGELPARKPVIDPTELMKAISQVKGVGYVRSLVIIGPGGEAIHGAYILDEGSFPFFEHDLAASPIRLMKDKYEVHIRESLFNDIRTRMEEAARRSSEPVVHAVAASRIRHGFYRDISYYQSLQHLFPVVYGIGAEGLAGEDSPARKAAARQLKTYLLFFEQVLANYLSQLASIPKLFAIDTPAEERDDPEPEFTYYSQPLYAVPGIRPLLRAFNATAPAFNAPAPASNAQAPAFNAHAPAFNAHSPGEEAAWEAFTKDTGNAYRQALAEGAETDETYRVRKNALLDHLLARFNERAASYPVTLFTSLYADKTGQTRRDEVIEWKSDLLKSIARSGYDRCRGFNYLSGNGTPDDRGGFYKKMAGLLYIRSDHVVLSDALFQGNGIHFGPQEKDQPADTGTDASATRSSDPSSGKERHRQDMITIAGDQTMRQLMEEGKVHSADSQAPGDTWQFSGRKMSFFREGLHAGNYTVGPDPGGSQEWLILFRDPAENNPQIISRHPDEGSAIQALKKLIARLRQINISSEGFHIIEHVLLRPPVDSLSFGFRFSTPTSDVLLQHPRWTSFKERETILAALLKGVETAPISGSRMTEWAIENLGRLCRIQLPRHQSYGFMTDPYDLQDWEHAEAEPVLENIRRQLLYFKETGQRLYPGFDMLVRGMHEGQIPEAFFNFKMTVVLPAWTARFQDPNFRLFVMDLFRMHTPAHIRLYFQWLNPSRMREFEDLYFNWTAVLKNQDYQEPRKVWSHRLIHFLKKDKY